MPDQTLAEAQILTRELRDSLSPQQVIELILEGNARFASGRSTRRDWVAEQQGTAEEQFPAAVFLSCMDSRAPLTAICDMGIGHAFNCRIAGNAVNDDVLGSLEYATAAAGAKLVMVLGHSNCGAILSAIDNVHSGNMTILLARFQNAIEETEYAGERTSANPAFVDAVAHTHLRRTLWKIRERSLTLRELEAAGAIAMVAAIYDLESGRISLI
ncbi:hypothetical protein L6Q21_16145 [Sandaracinobacter sp. RS1-74]|uniref:carbonic anhydrase family protein n=1 Tax=Sandaracinobacteroides sayramensis TaxID=2913411 RepID=UPI001ED9E1DA|nr:hypothetical protein [Sandaracinobacteroides sayramensis]